MLRTFLLDLKLGVRITRSLMLMMLLAFALIIGIKTMSLFFQETDHMNFIDIILALWYGAPPLEILSDAQPPADWIFLLASLLFFCFLYTSSSLKGVGECLLLKGKKRWHWLISKYLWILAALGFWNLITFLMAVVFADSAGRFFSNAQPEFLLFYTTARRAFSNKFI